MKLLRVHCHTESREKISVYSLEMHPDLIGFFKDLGVVEVEEDMISAEELLRVKKIMRLKSDLGVNLTGAAIIVDLLDRIEEMQDEIKRLKV